MLPNKEIKKRKAEQMLPPKIVIIQFFHKKCYCGTLHKDKFKEFNPPALCLYCKILNDILPK